MTTKALGAIGGAIIWIKCHGCNRRILLERRQFERRVKEFISRSERQPAVEHLKFFDMRSHWELHTWLEEPIFTPMIFNSGKCHALYLTGTGRFPPASKLAGIQRRFLSRYCQLTQAVEPGFHIYSSRPQSHFLTNFFTYPNLTHHV